VFASNYKYSMKLTFLNILKVFLILTVSWEHYRDGGCVWVVTDWLKVK